MSLKNLILYNEDCIKGAIKISDKSIDLICNDPPFCISESTFDKHYNRKKDNVIEGYVEAPNDYQKWTEDWLKEAYRILKDDGSMYLVSGWSKLREVLNACENTNWKIINHIIWKYNFGVWNTTKYITSHYHILYMSKSKPKFNNACRFGSQEKDDKNLSLQYHDREDVWAINKEYHPGEKKNKNKLPNELIQKMIQYSSDPGDVVCDFFMGNFTTAYVSLGLGRKVIGFELNKESFDYHSEILKTIEFGYQLPKLKKVVDQKPLNQGKLITKEERDSICFEYKMLYGKTGITKKDIIKSLQEKYQRGKFAIINILGKCQS